MTARKATVRVTGIVENIRYQNEDTGYTVMILRCEDTIDLTATAPNAAVQTSMMGILDKQAANDSFHPSQVVTVVGTLPSGLDVDEEIQVDGVWKTHPTYGKQIEVISFVHVLPSTESGMLAYLSSGRIKGIGPAIAGAIVELFGSATFDVISNTPDALLEIKGISSGKLEKIKEGWAEDAAIRINMAELMDMGISATVSLNVIRHFGSKAAEIARENPYKLVDVRGIGFLKADEIALGLGVAEDSPMRMQAGLLYALDEAAKQNGHTYLPSMELFIRAAELLNANEWALKEAYEALLLDGQIILRKVPDIVEGFGEIEVAYHQYYFRQETSVATRLAEISRAPSGLFGFNTDEKIDEVLATALEKSAISLHPLQAEGVRAAVANKISIITGGPGTGKTTCLKTLLDMLDEKQVFYGLASPTGKAAKRLAETSSRSAQTVHRMIGMQGHSGDCGYNEENPMPYDFIVVDEASMIDLWLMDKLLEATSPQTHLLFVGDVDQLPSVGVGNILRDMISSCASFIHVTRLDVVYRQALDSGIIRNAHKINAGEMPHSNNNPQKDDFFVLKQSDGAKAREMIVQTIQALVNAHGYDPLKDIQVLAPMKKGDVGVTLLNSVLQSILNPPSPSKPEKTFNDKNSTTFRVGDKVIQTVNNHSAGVYNGDEGIVTNINGSEKYIEVAFDGTVLSYEFAEALDNLLHSYALTVHKSQGSEYPVVIMPVMTAHWIMMKRNLLYTAVTRAKGICVLIGQHKAINQAVRNNEIERRYSALNHWLQGYDMKVVATL